MKHPVKGVDHVFLLVDDLDASADAYRRLGFTVSPRGTHSAEKGSANHTIVFADDYFELLGIVADTPSNLHQREMLGRDGGGLHAIACRIDSAAAARATLAELGIAAEPVGEFSRPLPLPDGSTGVAAFAVTEFARGEAPSGFVFMCEHKTPEMVWRPELQRHANGATALAGIVVVADDPRASAEGFARLFAAGTVRPAGEGALAVATGERSARILVMTPEAAAARYSAAAVRATPATGFAALQVRVDDPDRARAALTAGGIAFHEGAGGVLVDPADASGAIIEFVRG